MSTYKKYVKQLKPITFITFDDKSIWDNESGVLRQREYEIFDESENGDPINALLHYDEEDIRYSYAFGQRTLIENQPSDNYSLILGAYEYDSLNTYPFVKAVVEIPFNERIRFDKSFTVSMHFNKTKTDEGLRGKIWNESQGTYLNQTNSSTFTRTIFRKGNTFGLAYNMPYYSNNYITVTFPNNSGTILLSDIAGGAINRDVHVVYTHNHIINEAGQWYTVSKVYWDNRVIYSHTTSPVFGTYNGGSTSPIEIGGYFSSVWDPNSCNDRTTTKTFFDQFSVYDYALEDFQVSNLYKKCYQYETIISRSFPTLYYKFNELIPTTSFSGGDAQRNISYIGTNNVTIKKERPGVHGVYGGTKVEVMNKAMLYSKPVDQYNSSYYINFFNPNGNFTIDFFASFDGDNKGVLLSIQDDVHPFRGLTLFVNTRHNAHYTGSIQLSVTESDYILTQEKTPRGEHVAYNDGIMRHYTIRRSGSYIELWINAVLIDKIFITTGSLTTRINQLYMFGLMPGNMYVNGSIQHMAFYTRALSEQELIIRSSYLIKYTIKGRVTVQGIGQVIYLRVYAFNSGELIHEAKSDSDGNYDVNISTDDYISIVYMDVGNINIRPRVVGPTLADEYEDIPWE